MKTLLFWLLLSIVFFTGNAQQIDNNADVYYYFGNQKIYLQQSKEQLFVRFKAAEAASVKMNIRNNFQLSEKAFTNTDNNRVVVISLKVDNKVSRQKELIQYLETSDKTELIRPALKANDGKEVVIDEGFYVKLKPSTTYNQLANLASQLNCAIEKGYSYDNKTFLLKAGANNGYDGLKMANRFFETGLFVYAEPDFRLMNALHVVPNDPLYNLQWAHLNTGAVNQGSGIAGADIDVDEAWDITMGSPSIRIAVLDEGVQRNHPDLINNIDPLGFGLTVGNSTTGNILSSNSSHGTACAGIIAAEANNNIGVAGVAPLSKIIPVNIIINTSGVFGTSAQIATAIDWSWNEGAADILSNSWGGGTASSLVQDAIRRATTMGRGGKGAIVIFSSGNNDAGVASPAIFPETIAVGAMSMCLQRKSPTTCDGENFWGGNYGTGLDISGPGVRIATTRNTGTGSAPNADYNLAFNGTSAATPFVAGVAALVLSINNNFTQTQVREILERSARKIGGYNYTATIGQPNGSWSSELGHGMVNAKNAVLAAQNPAFCRVEIAASGNLQVCNGSSVSIQVTNVTSGNTYQWRRDGDFVSVGNTFSANQSGNYDVVLTTGSGCKDTSYALNVIVSMPQGTLVANAGRDTAICNQSKVFLGGAPSGTGGTGILHPMRGLGSDLSNNTLMRFNPLQPSLEYKIINNNFIPNFLSGNFFSGAAATPTGLFMIDKPDKILSKIDTATGATIPIGITTSANVFFNGMSYDATTDKIFAVATSGTSNQLYEINRLSGTATLLGAITGIPSSITLASLSVDNSGQLFALRLSSSNATLYSINKISLAATLLGNTGFEANFANGADIDPMTDILYHFGVTNPVGSSSTSYAGKGLWTINKSTGAATLKGSIGQPFNAIDALSFAKSEYKYQWSPATNLSNSNDANPQFTATNAGTFTYTLTVTDLCGITATDQVTVVVNPLPVTVLNPAPVLSQSNGFASTLTYTQEAGLDYNWVVDGVVQPNTSNSFPISFNNSISSQFSVRTTIPASGCISNSTPVSFTYAPGVLLNNNNALTLCDSSFYDAGGPQGNTGSNFTRTFSPASADNTLRLSFYNLQLAQFASLFVYDGPNANAPRIEALSNSFNGTTLREYTASNPAGVLTVRFTIGSSQSAGWLAGITCQKGLQFRTTSSGNWTSTSIWESKLSTTSTWTAATRLPNKGDEIISIQHEVVLSEPLQIDDVVISASGKLNVSTGGSLNLYKVKTGSELLVEPGGTLQLASTRNIFGNGIIELKGNLINEGDITVEELLVNGTAPQVLSNASNSNSSITRLTMNNAAGLTVQGLHRIGSLTLNNGLIQTSANNTLVLENSATGTASSYVNGVLQFMGKSGMTFNVPIGKNGVYRPVILTANNSDGEGSALMQAEVMTGAPTVRTFPAGINNVSSVRYYRVSVLENGINVRDFGITLPYGTDDAVTDHTILKIAKDNGAGAWLDLGGTATGAAPGTITSNEFNSFSDFVLANVLAAPLPVNLIGFNGRLQQNQALLNWSAEQEINFEKYELERSTNGINFTSMASIPARSSTTLVSYSYTDISLPNSAIIYYRLKMIDIDGKFRYSNIIQLKRVSIAENRIVSIAPNPFVNTITIQYESNKKENLQVAIYNSKGQLILQTYYKVVDGVNQLYIDGSELAAGVYLLQLRTSEGIITQKIIKQ
jgi:subtilisin family serine protease